jgi:hypothetical protein
MPAGSDFVYPLVAGGLYYFNCDGTKIDFIGGASGLMPYTNHDDVTCQKKLTVEGQAYFNSQINMDTTPIYDASQVQAEKFTSNQGDLTTRMEFQGSGITDWYQSNTQRMRLESGGDLHVDADVIAYSSTVSDIRLKTNIKPITSSLATICKLDGIKYDWKYRDGKDQLGLIAQQVEKHVPEVIKETTLPFYASSSYGPINEDGFRKHILDDDTLYKTVRYEQLVPHLIESIKELKLEIDELKLKLENNNGK